MHLGYTNLFSKYSYHTKEVYCHYKIGQDDIQTKPKSFGKYCDRTKNDFEGYSEGAKKYQS